MIVSLSSISARVRRQHGMFISLGLIAAIASVPMRASANN